MMGVGFCAQNIIADNPFLHAPQTPQGQPLYPSYYIDSGCIMLGKLPPPNIAYQALTPQAKPADLQYAGIDYQCWNNPTGSLTVNRGGNNTVDVANIAMLLDTGLDLMMVVNVPGFSLPPSQPVAVNLSGATVSVAVSDTLLNYSFRLEAIGNAQFGASTATCPVYTTVNSSTTTSASGAQLVALQDTNAVSGPAPSLVHAFQGSNSEPPFLNIGFNPLFGWGMLFDAANNRVGFLSV
jgi:hypothetical protein